MKVLFSITAEEKTTCMCSAAEGHDEQKLLCQKFKKFKSRPKLWSLFDLMGYNLAHKQQSAQLLLEDLS